MSNEKTVEKVTKLLENTWNPIEFCEFFMENNEAKLSEIVSEKLREEGYPITANYINIDFTLSCTNKKSFSEWGEMALEVYINDDEKTNVNDEIRVFFIRNEDMFMYMNNLDNIQFNVKFKLTPEEYVELVPDLAKVEKGLEQKWSSELLVERMLESQYEPLLEGLREQAKESGFNNSEKIEISDLSFSVNVKNKLDFRSWAEIALEKYVYGSLERFLQTEMFFMYLGHPEHLDIEIAIETDSEEWNEDGN